MPKTRSAKKKVRVDLRRHRFNQRRIRKLKKAMKEVKDARSLSLAFKQIDKAAKSGVIHRNKAARLKSRLSRRLAS